MPEEKKETPKSAGKCKHCAKVLKAYVVANGQLFCSDDCVKDFFAKK